MRKPGRATSKGTRPRNAVPAANLRTMLAIVTDRGIAPERMLEGTTLTVAALQSPDLRVPAAEAARAVQNAYRITGDAGLGLEYGLRTKVTGHGYLGLAAMACGTLREAFDLVVRYIHLRQRDFSIAMRVEDGAFALVASDNHDVGLMRRMILEGMLIGFCHMGGFLVGEEKPECEIWFDWPEPAYHAAYRARLPRVRYGMPEPQARFPARYLDKPLVMADPEAMRRAVEQCERELGLVGASPQNLQQRVREMLRGGPQGYPGLDEVAARLFMSGRSLKRKLHERGTSFQALLDEARLGEARRLLENPDLDIQQIATALGYSDPPSFTRAFRRWSGTTPSAMREKLRG